MPMSGGVTREFTGGRAVEGDLSFSGALTTSTITERFLAGVLSFTGALGNRSPARRISLSGVLSFTGRLTHDGLAVGAGLFRSLWDGLWHGGLFK